MVLIVNQSTSCNWSSQAALLLCARLRYLEKMQTYEFLSSKKAAVGCDLHFIYLFNNVRTIRCIGMHWIDLWISIIPLEMVLEGRNKMLIASYRHPPLEPIAAALNAYTHARARTSAHTQSSNGNINVTMETNSLGSLS